MKTVLVEIALLAGIVNAVQAQTDFQLPRECLERQVPDPSKCEIQDGPPHRVYPATRHLHKPAGPKPAQPATTSTPATTPSAPFKAPR